MQGLYQIEARGGHDLEEIRASVGAAPQDESICGEALELALAAWEARAAADELAARLAPQWPTHRQPLVDRSILRLAHYEMASGRTPVPVAINEAVDLAREFGSEQSGGFVNAVLDKMARTADAAAREAPVTPPDADPPTEVPSSSPA